jgi:flavin reductase (DIM6/NTAB) family NADH-FMN oxidoreductase RutF
MTVVTAAAAGSAGNAGSAGSAATGARGGCLVGFTTQGSMDPARFLVCLSKRNHTYGVAQRARFLAVHALTAAQRELASLFGERTGDDVDKFAGRRWRPGPDGVPILEECDRWFVGEIIARVDLGDHVGFVLEPVLVPTPAEPSSAPLRYSAVRDLQAGHEP